ncbi:MAG: helix-turn-helix transcriptional regulator, partial [Sphingobacterium sp.]
MIIKAKIKGDNDWLFWEELPEDQEGRIPISEKNISVNRYPIEISSYQILSNGIFLTYTEMFSDKGMEIISEIDTEAIVSQFIIGKNQLGKVIFSKHNIRYIPSLLETHSVPENQQFTYFLLVMTPAYYNTLVTVYTPLNSLFKQRMTLNNKVSIFEEDLPASVEMLNTINEITKAKEKKELKQIYTNAKV